MRTLNDKRGVYMYGNVVLVRELCPKCGGYSFIRDGKTLCCRQKVNVERPDKIFRVSESPLKRRKPSKRERDEILAQQRYECFYCGQPFNSVHLRHKKPVTLRINWEHFVPFSYSQDNRKHNFVAACHVCNGIKAALHFSSIIHAMVYISLKRKEKGYDF